MITVTVNFKVSGSALKPGTLDSEFGWVQAAHGQLPAPLGI